MIDLVKIGSIFEVLSRKDGRLGAASSKQRWTDEEIVELRALAIRGLLALYFDKPKPKQDYHVHPRDRDLHDLIRQARDRYEALSFAQKKAHDDAQRASWVRGEMGIGSDKDEAAYRAAREACLHQRATHALDFSYCPDCGKYSEEKHGEAF